MLVLCMIAYIFIYVLEKKDNQATLTVVRPTVAQPVVTENDTKHTTNKQ